MRARTVLAAAGGVALALQLTLATAGPASGRQAASPAASTAATGVVTLTGSVSWYEDTLWNSAPGDSGGDTKKATFNVQAVTVGPLADFPDDLDFRGSTYTFSDNTDDISNYGGCLTTLVGSKSGSAPLVPGSTSGARVLVGRHSGWYTLAVGVGLSGEKMTQTTTGPSGCHPGTSIWTTSNGVEPDCIDQHVVSGLLGMQGKFTGHGYDGTVKIACSGTSGNLVYHAAGTLDLTTKGITITSPPNNSIVALTDGHYFQPQPTPADNITPSRPRKLIVKGTTACPGVRVNGTAATVTGDRWTVKLPARPLGKITITASAAGCRRATSKVTMIDLRITQPANDRDALPVTAAPAMPELRAHTRVDGYSGDTSAVSFHWTLEVFGTYRTRDAASPGGYWHPYAISLAAGRVTGTQSAWEPSLPNIVGGWGRLVVTADLPGVLGGAVHSDPRWIDIGGTNPGTATVKNFIARQCRRIHARRHPDRLLGKRRYLPPVRRERQESR